MALVVKKLKPAFLTFLSFSEVATHRTYFSLRFQPFNRRREPSNHSVLLKSLNCEDQKDLKRRKSCRRRKNSSSALNKIKDLGDHIWITTSRNSTKVNQEKMKICVVRSSVMRTARNRKVNLRLKCKKFILLLRISERRVNS